MYFFIGCFFFLFCLVFFFFFFQAEDGIRDRDVTGVQTCLFRSFFFHCDVDCDVVVVVVVVFSGYVYLLFHETKVVSI